MVDNQSEYRKKPETLNELLEDVDLSKFTIREGAKQQSFTREQAISHFERGIIIGFLNESEWSIDKLGEAVKEGGKIRTTVERAKVWWNENF